MSHSTVSASALSKGFVSRRGVLACVLVAFAVVEAAAAAQASPPTAAASSQTVAASAKAQGDHRPIKPGDRACLRHTGSLIPPKKGDCLPVAGRSYSQEELRNTGATDNAHALQMLDPSISVGH